MRHWRQSDRINHPSVDARTPALSFVDFIDRGQVGLNHRWGAMWRLLRLKMAFSISPANP
jgi:hypothetical protein